MPGQRLKWIPAARNGGSPPTIATSTQLVPAGVTVAIYGFRLLRGDAIADFYTGTDATGELLSSLACGDGNSDRDPLDGNGGMVESHDGVWVRVYGEAYDAAILVDYGCIPA